MSNTREKYFNWLVSIIFDERISNKTYRKLLKHLFEIDFFSVIEMDNNRIQDGLYLRYRFCYENNISELLMYNILGNKPCSVLEMMVALSKRCENMFENVDHGATKMFWDMIRNLNLYSMDDHRFDSSYVNDCIERMIFRDYSKSGEGGLFFISDKKKDARDMEIWSQAMHYLNNTMV